MKPTQRISRSASIAALLVATALLGSGCARRFRLEMGGLPAGSLDALPANATAMNCELRRGLLSFALRCPGILYPESTVEMDVSLGGAVQCVSRRDQEDDCPLVVSRLLGVR